MRERGQGLAEYALIMVFVSLAAIMALEIFGEEIAAVLGDVRAALANIL